MYDLSLFYIHYDQHRLRSSKYHFEIFWYDAGSYSSLPLTLFVKFYDFLNNIKTNLVMLFFCQKVNFCDHRALAKIGQKKVC